MRFSTLRSTDFTPFVCANACLMTTVQASQSIPGTFIAAVTSFAEARAAAIANPATIVISFISYPFLSNYVRPDIQRSQLPSSFGTTSLTWDQNRPRRAFAQTTPSRSEPLSHPSACFQGLWHLPKNPFLRSRTLRVAQQAVQVAKLPGRKRATAKIRQPDLSNTETLQTKRPLRSPTTASGARIALWRASHRLNPVRTVLFPADKRSRNPAPTAQT